MMYPHSKSNLLFFLQSIIIIILLAEIPVPVLTSTSTSTSSNLDNGPNHNHDNDNDLKPREEELPIDQWYTKYESYPEYCSTPTQMDQRSIPQLDPHINIDIDTDIDTDTVTDVNFVNDVNDLNVKVKVNTKLLHVTAVIRHGARTPSRPHPCWEGFWSSNAPAATDAASTESTASTDTVSDTAIWNCELTTMIAPPSQKAIQECELYPNGCNIDKDEIGIEHKNKNDIDNINDNKSNTNRNIHNTNNDKDKDGQDGQDGQDVMFLLDKKYNALQSPPQLKNELNGTCQVGQLLLRGYVQELHNGQMLREAYMKEYDGNGNDNGNVNGNDSMVLFDLTEQENGGDHNDNSNSSDNGNDARKIRPYEEPNLYYRADDDQRTLMSGQVLLRGLFGDEISKHSKELGPHANPIIALHTADKSRDILAMNLEVCPRLEDIQDDAKNSQEYLDLFVNSKESQIMNDLMMKELGGEFQSSAMDCMMSTICTDRQLPSILDDFGKDGHNNHTASYGTNLFDRLQKYSYLPKNYVLQYNDSQYSKLAIGPLWVEMLSNILAYVPKTKMSFIPNHIKSKLRYPTPPKLALFSAHDATLHMLLASLGNEVFGGNDWAPFASYFVIELHDIIVDVDSTSTSTNENKKIQDIFPTGKAFRLIFNGNVLTSKIEGCPAGSTSELCDISKLMKVVESFAVTQRSCEKVKVEVKQPNYELSNNIYSKEGIAIAILISLVSGVLGSIFTFYYLTRRLPCDIQTRRKQYKRFDKNERHDGNQLPVIS